ncbi:MAG: DUF4278 domain-containing protein [Leptolyngbya sp. SIO1D8]|nr:DUF4278 domain-containing protein [Leptolyngbya sp. SIO1D8]
MQFIYRGIPYQAPVMGTDATETEQTGTFLGATYKMKQGATAQHRDRHQLVYRGVRYR